MIAQYVRNLSFTNHWMDLSIRAGYVLLHQLDLALTVYSTSRGSLELNPFMENVLRSPDELIVLKTIIPAIIALLAPTKLIAPGLALLVLVNLLNMWQLMSSWL